MATVRVTSEHVETDGSETEEFFAEAVSIYEAIVFMLNNEHKTASEEWFLDVSFRMGQAFYPEGFSFTITDNGSRDVILYRYVFTV